MAQHIAAIGLGDLDHRITLTVEETASLLDLGRTAVKCRYACDGRAMEGHIDGPETRENPRQM